MMWQSLENLVRGGFFKDALPEAAFWGRIAVSVGVIGFFVSILAALMHLRDKVSLRGAEHPPIVYIPPKWGPLSRSLKEFFADPVQNAPLSPDAAAEYVIGRLEATRDANLSVIRYLSYAPLLFGLMGTILALRGLLVVQGKTLEQIQPLLAGVFAGTLGGIIGSLVASAGGMVLDWVSLSATNDAQDFIHRHIISVLPERRISIRVEDAVLSLIGEKAEAVAQNFGKALQPVTSNLEQIANRCSEAAGLAMKSLTEAARAVREAGNVEAASRDFKIGAHMIDSAAEQLSDATKQTAEVILHVGEIRESLEGLLVNIRESSKTLGEANTRVADELVSRIAELNSRSERLDAGVRMLGPTVEELSTVLQKRANSDSAHLETIQGHIESTSRNFADVTNILRESADHLNAIPRRIDEIAGTITESARQGVGTEMAHVTDEFTRRLDTVVTGLERSAVIFSAASKVTETKEGDKGDTSADFVGTVQQAAQEMRKVCEESRKLVAVLQQIQVTQTDGSSKKGDGFFRRFWDR
jgi:uncharacterized protein YukE